MPKPGASGGWDALQSDNFPFLGIDGNSLLIHLLSALGHANLMRAGGERDDVSGHFLEFLHAAGTLHLDGFLLILFAVHRNQDAFLGIGRKDQIGLRSLAGLGRCCSFGDSARGGGNGAGGNTAHTTSGKGDQGGRKRNQESFHFFSLWSYKDSSFFDSAGGGDKRSPVRGASGFSKLM